MPREQNSVEISRPLRLLLVEDSRADAELLVSVLKRTGYVVTYDWVELQESFCEKIGKQYDAILCDHNLLNWTGMDALAIARKSFQSIPFIVVTGTIGEEAVAEYLKQGADDYVLKGRLERLPLVLGRALAERAKADENAQLHEAILCAKQEWELTFDAVTDALMVLDAAGTVRRANRAAVQMLGMSFSELIGRPHDEVFHRSENSECICPFRSMIETGEHQRTDVLYPSLKKTFDVIASPLRDSAGTLRGGTLVMRDISRRLQMDEQLRQAQKMEAVGLLAGGIAHDFNNLLNVISGNVEMLSGERVFTQPQQQELEEVKKAVRRAARLTSQLLAFSRRQVLQPKVLTLNAVVSDVVGMLQRLIGEDVKVVAELNAEKGVIRADQTQLEQVLLNLATNARDAMPEGGRLTIRTEDSELGPDDKQRYPYVNPGSYVRLTVIDTGQGIPPDVVNRIFEPFFTTKEKGHGTGLGLAVVYGIVKQSGGYIWVTSESEHGTRFDIYLPQVNDVPITAEKPAAAFTPQPTGTGTIMVIEDEDAVLHVISQFLIRAGYSVLQASNSRRALEIAEGHADSIPLAIVDTVLPDMNGPATAERLRTIHPEMEFLFMSGYVDRSILKEFLTDGRPFLQKPITRAELLARVGQVLQTKAAQATRASA